MAQCAGNTVHRHRCLHQAGRNQPWWCWQHIGQAPKAAPRIICPVQNTDDWLEARRGKITASMLAAVFAGKETRRRYDYTLRLVMDLEGIPDFEDDAPWFSDGRYYEQYARGWYAWQVGKDVQQCGFILHPTIDFIGCSPDGQVAGEPGGIEIKFRKSLRTFHASKHLTIKRPTMLQIQLQMLCQQWDWIDYVNYWRNDQNEIEQGHIKRYARNIPIQREIENKCIAFWMEVCALYKKRNGKPPVIS